MGFRDESVSPMVGDVLRAGECALFRKSGRPAGNEGSSLIVAEACKDCVLARKVVVQADVELTFVHLSYRIMGEVRSNGREGIAAVRIEIDQILTDGIDQAGRNEVARCP